MSIQNITFLWPQVIYASLLIFVFIILFIRLFTYRNDIFASYTSSAMEDQLKVPRNAFIYWIKLTCLCVAWVLATLALMQPMSYGEYPQEIKEKEYKRSSSGYKRSANAVLFVIDTSASMSVNGRSGDLLSNAKEMTDLVISQMEGQQISLISFTSEPTMLSPLTFDYLFVRLMLQQLQINEGGEAGTDLLKLFDFIAKETFPNIPLSIVLFSDGGDTGLEFTSEENQRKRESAILEAVQNIKRADRRIYTIGLGSKQGIPVPGVSYEGKLVISKLNESLLKKIAETGNGRYFHSEEFTSVNLADQLAHILNESGEKIDVSHMPESPLFHYYFFQIPLAGAILLLLCLLFLPDSIRKAQAILAFSVLFFGDLAADLHHEMLEAKSYADIKNYKKAVDLYNQILNQNLKPWQAAIVLYNMGTVHLEENQYDDAINVLTTVPVKDYPSSLLQYTVSYNLTLAYLGKAQALQKRPSLAVDVLKKAKDQVHETHKAFCSLQLQKGAKECKNQTELAILEDFISEKLSVLLEQEKIDSLLHSTFNQGIKELINLIDESTKDLVFLENANFEEGQREKYQTLFLSEIQSWIPIWIYLKKQLNSKDPNKIKLFNFAASHFLQALSHMEQRNYIKSKEQFALSKKNLEELLKGSPKEEKKTEQKTPETRPSNDINEEADKEKGDIGEVTQLLIEMNQLDTMQKKTSGKRKGDPKSW